MRGGLIVLAMCATAALVIFTLWWLSAMKPLSSGASSSRSISLGPGKPTVGQGTVYAWKRGGIYQVTLWLHNSSSLPLSVTGTDSAPADGSGAFSGPTLNLVDQNGTHFRHHLENTDERIHKFIEPSATGVRTGSVRRLPPS